jgi:hypothetical protein
MPIEQRAVDAVFFQDELQFLAQGLIDLSGDTSQQLFPWHDESLTAQLPKPSQNDGIEIARMNYLTIRGYGKRLG